MMPVSIAPLGSAMPSARRRYAIVVLVGLGAVGLFLLPPPAPTLPCSRNIIAPC